jgi:hypothetical protein
MAQTMEPSRCEECGLVFNSEEELRKHQRTFHPEESHGEQQYPQSSRNPGAEERPSLDRSQSGKPGERKQQPPSPKRAAS